MNTDFLRDRAKFSATVARRYGVTEAMYLQVTELLAPLATPISLRKGEFLQRIGSVAQSVFWMQSGVARVGFFTEAGAEVTLRFLMDGEPAGSHEDLLRARCAAGDALRGGGNRHARLPPGLDGNQCPGPAP